MIELKVTGTESWFDPNSARKLSASLGRRLWDRCEGHRGLFVTLTYRRDEWEDAKQLYRAQSEEQHVPLFLRKVARHLGDSLKGRWFCKLEFQRGGWVHWHIIILDVNRIDHAVLSDLWGFGHVWVRRLNARNVKYCTKYTVKAGDVPAWLYLEKPRAVKIIRVSHGFWEEGEPDSGPVPPDPYDEYGPVPQRIDGVYVPIGEKLERAKGRWVARDEHGHYVRGQCDLSQLLVSLMERGCGVVGNRAGWIVVDATLEDLARAGTAAERLAQASRSRPLHLIRSGNPDADEVEASRMPLWLDDLFRWWAGEGVCGG